MYMMIIYTLRIIAMTTSFDATHEGQQNVPGYIVFQDNIVNILKEHNHPKSQFIKAQIKMKEEMLRLSRETNTGLKEIFDTICRRYIHLNFFYIFHIFYLLETIICNMII